MVFESGNASPSDTAKSPSTNSDTKKGKQIAIDVEGAVLKPGVYMLPFDSRVQDALIVAGGMSDKADRLKVAKGMNLAAKLIDGGKIYIPFQGDSASTAQGGGSSENVLGDATSSMVNINTASDSELDGLSGVGPSTVKKITANRPYGSIDELLSKKVVGKSVFEKIKGAITVN
jgi:competence protein ComEA